EDVTAPSDLPGFDRATMDGFAVQAASTFGASEASPAYLEVVGTVAMGRSPEFAVGPGQAAQIATGGMLPPGSDSVLMVEHSDTVGDNTIEAHRSVAPGQHTVAKDEDVAKGQLLLAKGRSVRAQEIGLLAAGGVCAVTVYRYPRVGVISTGDEVVPVDVKPALGQVRDINTHTLCALVQGAGARAISYGIVGDHYDDLYSTCTKALDETDMVLISGGSSVGFRDLTLGALEALDRSRVLAHGISMRPGKPTILVQNGAKAIWGLPGHVASAMVVFMQVVRPFLDHLAGRSPKGPIHIKARLSRNLASVQGRLDFVRVRLGQVEGETIAEPVLGQSGLIHTMVDADGLVAIGMNSEGLDKGAQVDVMLFLPH
ncbi:MAG: molybdopterin molybdotransferase MoeA, partial [Desulfobacteraceae bacterium]